MHFPNLYLISSFIFIQFLHKSGSIVHLKGNPQRSDKETTASTANKIMTPRSYSDLEKEEDMVDEFDFIVLHPEYIVNALSVLASFKYEFSKVI